MEAHI